MAEINLGISVRQLLVSVVAAVNRGGLEGPSISLEDILANLETSDENFQSYHLVKYIHEHIEAEIGPLVDKYIDAEMGSLEDQQHGVLAKISDEILASEEFAQLCYNLPSNIKTTVDELLQQGSISQPSLGTVSHNGTGPSTSGVYYYNLENSIGSDLSSLRETGVMFVPEQKVLQIVERLSTSQTSEIRLDALHELQRYPLGDLPQYQDWHLLHKCLRECLKDTDQQLVDSTLRILSLMFGTLSGTMAREIHEIIVRHLISWYKESQHTAIEHGLKIIPVLPVIYQFRFLHHIHTQVSTHWIRYNERVLEDIFDGCFTLLELSYTSKSSSITPIHYVSLLDPLAKWFHKWMHPEYSRSKVFDQLMSRTILVEGLLLHIINYTGCIKYSLSQEDWEYSGAVLHYLHYLHAVRMIEKLLSYERGQILLTQVLNGLSGEVNCISKLLIHLLEQAFHLPIPDKSLTSNYEMMWSPVKLVSNLLTQLASGNQKCRQLLYNDRFTSTIIQYLDHYDQYVNEEMLEHTVDVLAILAASVDGRRYLLNECNAGHEIAQYVVTSLDVSHVGDASRILYACLFFCRQVYSTAEGLLTLLSFGLHNSIAQCLSNTNESDWRNTLINNLLNFASTPKGVVMLGDTKLMPECVQYMHKRYHLKLQVSHCEKFGYGFMVTQVASTSCGMKCLVDGGYVSDLIQVLWTILQEEGMEEPLLLCTHSLDPSNHILHKAIINVLNILSSYTSLHEALVTVVSPHHTELTMSTKNEYPHTINEFLQWLVFSDSVHKFMNPNESHLCALRILSVLITSLDSFLYLETQFGIINHICRLQKEVQLSDCNFIIDACSIQRNRILVTIYFIGGPSERVLPPHYLSGAEDCYQYPIFCTLPPSSVYIKSPNYCNEKMKIDCSKCTKLSGLQEIFVNELKKSKHLSTHNIGVLLEKRVNLIKEKIVAVKSPRNYDLSKMDLMGIELVMRYGQQIGILKESDRPSLCNLLLQSGIKRQDDDGFDWFLVTVFMIMSQYCHQNAVDATLQFINKFSSLSCSAYTWKYHSNRRKDLLCCVSIHHIELILQTELPLVHSAFRISGYCPSQVCQDWINQCFWNYLDWPEICLYIVLNVVMGVDYQVYYCIAVFAHLKEKILKACQEQNLLVLLKEEMICEFNTASWMGYLKSLEEKYRHIVIKDMREWAELKTN